MFVGCQLSRIESPMLFLVPPKLRRITSVVVNGDLGLTSIHVKASVMSFKGSVTPLDGSSMRSPRVCPYCAYYSHCLRWIISSILCSVLHHPYRHLVYKKPDNTTHIIYIYHINSISEGLSVYGVNYLHQLFVIPEKGVVMKISRRIKPEEGALLSTTFPIYENVCVQQIRLFLVVPTQEFKVYFVATLFCI